MAKFEYETADAVYEIEAESEAEADKLYKAARDKEAKAVSDKIKAFEDHEDFNWREAWKNAKTPWEKIDSGLDAVFGPANRALEKIPGVGPETPMRGFVGPSAIKGIPGVGRMVPQTPYLTKMEEEYPKTAKGIQIAGGTAATLPLSAGVSAMVGPGFLKQFAGQGLVNTGLNITDTIARKGELSPEDAKHDVMWGAGGALFPAALTKIMGQSPRMRPTDWADFMKVGGHRLPSGAFKPPPTSMPRTQAMPGIVGMGDDTNRAIATLLAGAGGAGIGHSMGHGFEGLVAGLLGGNFAAPLLQSAGQTTSDFLRNPSTQDIIRALIAQSKTAMTSPPEAP